MSRHIVKHGDEYLISPAASLLMCADAAGNAPTSAEGKVRAQRVLDETLAAARTAKFEQIDILETLLSSGAEPARLLPMFDVLVQRIGAQRVVDIMQNCLRTIPPGDAA